MDVDQVGLSFDSKPLQKGVRTAMQELDAMIGKLDDLSRFVDKVAGNKNMNFLTPKMNVAALKEQIDLAQTAIKNGNKDSLDLVRGMNKSMQLLYEQRLATTKQMAVEEIAIWNSLGVKVAGIEKARLAAHKADNAAFQQEELSHHQLLQRTMSSFAKSRDALRKEEQASVASHSAFMTRTSQAFAKYQTSQEAARTKAADSSIQTQVARATQQATGQYSALSTGKMIDPSKVRGLAGAFKELAVAGNDAHSMARGLASGFNLLWLTWGNLGPLFAGAVISNGFMQTAKVGMEFASTLAIIQNIGGNTAAEMKVLTEQMLALASVSPQGPREIAEAVRILSLAGLKAGEISAVMKTVMDFSVAGTTDLKTAAETLVSVSTAFGLGVQGFGMVSDIVSKASAESMTSVENFSAAMKTASVVSSQYGVSLKDTATQIMALSSIGIEASAAGTALRNAYADLSGRTQQVTKVLQANGIAARQANGDMKPLYEIIKMINERMKGMTGESQKNFLQAILSERGAKGIVQMLQMINTEATATGKSFTDALGKSQDALSDYAGFSAIKAAEMALTTENQFKQVRSIMETSMIQAYQAMEPSLFMIAQALQKTFGSPEFISTLETLVSAVARVGKAVAENINIIMMASAAYMGLKLVQLAIIAGKRIWSGLVAAHTALIAKETAAVTLNTTAQIANATAGARVGGVLAGFARLIPGLNIALGIGTAAWMLYEAYMADSKVTAEQVAQVKEEKLIDALTTEAEKLEKINALLREGNTLEQAQAKLDAAKTDAPRLDRMAELLAQQEKLSKIDLSKMTFGQAAGTAAQLNAVTRQIEELQTEQSALDRARKRVQEAAGAQYGIIEEQQAAKAKARKFGADTFSNVGTGVGGGQRTEFAGYAAMRDTLAKISQEYATLEEQAKKASQAELAILDDKFRAGLIAAGEYYAEYTEKAVAGETAVKDIARKAQDGLTEAYLKAAAERLSLHSSSMAKIAQSGIASSKARIEAETAENKRFESDRENLAQQYVSLWEKHNTAIVDADTTAKKRMSKNTADLLDDTKKAAEAMRLAWKKSFSDLVIQQEKFAVEQQYSEIDSRSSYGEQGAKARAFAEIEAMKIAADNVRNLDNEYSKLSKTYAEIQAYYLNTAGIDESGFVKMPDEVVLKLQEVAFQMRQIRAMQAESAGQAEVYREQLAATAEAQARMLAIRATSREIAQTFSAGLRDLEKGATNLGMVFDNVLVRLRQIVIEMSVIKPIERGVTGLFESMIKGAVSAYAGGSAGAAPSGDTYYPGEVTVPSASGGGYTGYGSRSGGLDGKGGFLSMLHPDETVFDHRQGQGMGGSTSIVVNNYGSDKATATETVDSRGNRSIEVTIGEAVAGQVRRPGSPMHTAVRNSFNAKPALVPR